jgi:imidazole glycerol-phosphate synthase subunit HisH
VRRIAVVDSGTGNLRSVARALQVAGGEPFLTSDPDEVRRAPLVVVPGQGAFRDCAAGLARHGLDQAVRESISSGKPYLGICLGLQVLFEESEEHGPVRGLGILPGRVVRFTPAPDRKVPHMGWNSIKSVRPDPLLDGIPDESFLYFTHSFHAQARPDDVALWCDYGAPFCAAVRRDNIFACQFHPEKSQRLGLKLLENFVLQS